MHADKHNMRLRSAHATTARQVAAARLRVLGHLASRTEGQSAVELALCLPILLMVVMGICNFGVAFNNYTELTNAVSIGARQIAISRGQTTDPCALVVNTMYGTIPQLTQSKLSFTFSLNGNSYSGTSCSSTSTSTGAAANLVAGSTVVVTTTYPCNLKVFNINYAPGCTLSTTASELVQ